ncbi:major capsid protein [Aeromonas phage JELG-KS1]|uniref:Major capsid protein n=1 Tax=Aeromonas phage JELG-KS1 TaxID=2951233 RepID=A0A9E7NND9_9CAUD|nr:major capsid protein [Aeromonas phage JELG-KS1]
MPKITGGQKIGANQGKGSAGADALALFLKVFGGEVLTAFERQAKTLDKVMVRTIASGKSAQFPVMGRTTARYLKQGESLDDGRKDIKHAEKVITIDGLLATDVLIFDIEDAMNHYDVRSEYSKQMGEALAIATDTANYAEMAKLVNSRATAASNENIAGLGAAAMAIVGTKDLTDAAKMGEYVIQALTILRAEFTKRYVPTGDRTFFTSPDVYSMVLAALMPNAANYAALIDPETGNIRNVMGFEIVETPHMMNAKADGAVDKPTDAFDGVGHVFPATGTDITTWGTATGQTKMGADNVCGIAMHRSAIATLKLKDMALERARRPEYQADQIIARYAMGHGGLRPEAVAGVIFSTKGAGVMLDKSIGG